MISTWTKKIGDEDSCRALTAQEQWGFPQYNHPGTCVEIAAGGPRSGVFQNTSPALHRSSRGEHLFRSQVLAAATKLVLIPPLNLQLENLNHTRGLSKLILGLAAGR